MKVTKTVKRERGVAKERHIKFGEGKKPMEDDRKNDGEGG